MNHYETAKILARLDQIKADNAAVAARLENAQKELLAAHALITDALALARATIATKRQDKRSHYDERHTDRSNESTS